MMSEKLNKMLAGLKELSEQELRELNHAVVARLRAATNTRCAEAMESLTIGDAVEFDANRRGMVRGIVQGLNTKTIAVLDTRGRKWKVTASLVRRVEDADARNAIVLAARSAGAASRDLGAELRGMLAAGGMR